MTRRAAVCHVAAAAVGLCVFAFLWLLLDRGPVLILQQNDSYVLPDPAPQGHRISIVWSAIERRNCDGVVIPRVVDSSGRVFEYARQPAIYHDLMQPGKRSFTKTLRLPLGMAPGPARYEPIVLRWCNPIQQLVWPLRDPPLVIAFTVAN